MQIRFATGRSRLEYGVRSLSDQLDGALALNKLLIPDLWQQEAVTALREGKDVVVQAPTSAGKTLIFELWARQGRTQSKAVYTVPTRALANDKLAEWRGQGWNVGIATGDLADNLDAPVVVATLETQKNRLIHGDGPDLLVVDEYQMIGDPSRGLNYELALALAPSHTQLLLFSGSVANPDGIVRWLERLGRKATLVRHTERPVPLEEVNPNWLNLHVPREIRGYWPNFVAKSLGAGLGPILIFAPRRRNAEQLAAELARQLPNADPLALSEPQRHAVGEHLGNLLKARVAYHHSGLSYAARAGVIEPLAKAGQLRVVVATMGLAAGINFSLRSVALAGDSYRRDHVEKPLEGDELLQMFGRAGRRGIDETGYVLISANGLRLRDAHPATLSRSGMVDWNALLGLMAGAADQGRQPFAEAVRVQERLFTTRPIFLGVEHALKHPDAPCGLMTDAERARHLQRKVRQMLNAKGEWEALPELEDYPIRDIVFPAGPSLPTRGSAPATCTFTSDPELVKSIGRGEPEKLFDTESGPLLGKAVPVAHVQESERLLLAKWFRKFLRWKGRHVSWQRWEEKLIPLLRRILEESHTPLVRVERREDNLVALFRIDGLPFRARKDSTGTIWIRPFTREIRPPDCARCHQVEACRNLSRETGTALLWRRMGLVETDGTPTRRGRITSWFGKGSGLAIAAALEDNSYPLPQLLLDLANLDAGFRFCGDDNRWAGHLAFACQQTYGPLNIPGYLDNGFPPEYGAGAAEVIESLLKDPASRQHWISDLLGPGDIDRALIEWRSLLRQIVHAPELDWDRWMDFKRLAQATFNETISPTTTELPPLESHQRHRVDHRLKFQKYH